MKNQLYLFLFLFLLIAASCTKIEEIAPVANDIIVPDPSIEVADGRLKFNTTESFRNLIEQMHNSGKTDLGENNYRDFEKKGFIALNRISSTNLKSNEASAQIDDEIVPDPYFSALLNKKREIEVNGVVYKITEFGTFFGPADRLDDLNDALAKYSANNTVNKNKKIASNELTELGDGLYRFDSYQAMQEEDQYEDNTGGGGSTTSGSSTTVSTPYSDIEYHNFDRHTIVGGWIQDAFGHNRAYNRTFNSNRRLRVNFYSVNYIVYSGVGINVKYQKKNWIGWSKTDCEELRWGWEGIIYEYKLSNSMPSTGPMPVRSEYTYVPGVKTKTAFTINIMDNEINVDYSKGLKAIKDFTWSWLERNLAPEAVKMRAEQLSQFREIFPNKVKMVVNQYDEMKKNCDSFSKVFDWGTCQISLTLGNGSSFTDIVGLKENATTFDIKQIKIYGIAKCGSKYKGIGIVRD